MYEYKVFTADTPSEQGLNELLAKISRLGWEPLQLDWDKMQVFARQPLTLNDQEKTMKNLKNMKLPEQVRDLVLLLTLGFVACAAFCGPDSDRDASKGRRGAMHLCI